MGRQSGGWCFKLVDVAYLLQVTLCRSELAIIAHDDGPFATRAHLIRHSAGFAEKHDGTGEFFLILGHYTQGPPRLRFENRVVELSGERGNPLREVRGDWMGHESANVFWVQSFTKRGSPCDIGEEYRDQSSFFGHVRPATGAVAMRLGRQFWPKQKDSWTSVDERAREGDATIPQSLRNPAANARGDPHEHLIRFGLVASRLAWSLHRRRRQVYCKDPPLVGDTFQSMRPTIDEPDPRPCDEVLYRA